MERTPPFTPIASSSRLILLEEGPRYGGLVIQAAIFDMDGVLIDSEPLWRASHIAALASYGVTITEDHVRAMAGKRTDEVMRHWRENYELDQVSDSALEKDVVSRVQEKIRLVGQELPGVRELIALFANHHVPLAVASSSAPEVIETVLDKLSLADQFLVVHSAKYEEKGKPHPGIFLTTARRLAVSPTHCLVFEDSLNGVRAALAAGMTCVAIPEPVNINNPEFQKADLVVSSLADLSWEIVAELMSRKHNAARNHP